MRFDLPNDLPHDLRGQQEREKEPAPPLSPSPLERHFTELRQQAENPKPMPRPVRKPKQVERPRTQQVERPPVPQDKRMARDRIPAQGIGVSLRDEELKLLSAVGRFRVVSTKDLSETVYDNRPSRLERDLAYLREHKLVEVNAVQARRDGKRGPSRQIEVVTLTPAGRTMARQTSHLAEDQKLYSGLVKPREVQHDTQIYRAYLKEAEQIERNGGTNLRVRLDFELKAEIQKAIYAERKADPERDLAEIKQQVAERFELPFTDGSIQIPDARIEYDLDQGSRSGHQDIEVLTAAYRPGHLRGKAQARFRLFASGADRATLSAKLEDDHHLLEQILEL
jgi:DNA-binding transcriptional ArsR family regulator